MKTRQPDHTTIREWLYLEPDGELNAGERSSLKQHLAECSDCRRESQDVAALTSLLEESRIEVTGDFKGTVAAGLPVAGWENRSPRTWIAASVIVVLLSLAAALLIGTAGQEAVSAVPLAALAAVWELLTSSALAGSGLLAASWKGLGLALQDVLGPSIWNVVAFGALILGLDVLLLRYLLRPPKSTVAADRDRDS